MERGRERVSEKKRRMSDLVDRIEKCEVAVSERCAQRKVGKEGNGPTINLSHE